MKKAIKLPRDEAIGDRRQFLKKVGTAAAAAPAVALLLSANAKSAAAGITSIYGLCRLGHKLIKGIPLFVDP